MANDVRLPEGFVQPDVYTAIMDRLKQDKDMVRLRDNARAMQAGPIIAGASEASRALGGGGLNLNPALAWASGLPGAPKNLGAIAQANPYQSPSDTLGKLMAMGKLSGDANDRYLTQRDKFFASTMGRPLGAAGIEGKLQLEDKKADRREIIEDKKLAGEENLLRMKIDAAKSQEDADKARKALDDWREEQEKIRIENEKKDAAATAENQKFIAETSNIESVFSTLKEAYGIISKYKGSDDLPGLGRADAPGGEILQAGKDLLLGKSKGYRDDAQSMRRIVQDFTNTANRIMNSSRATDKDYARAVGGLGFGLGQNEDQAIDAFERYRSNGRRLIEKQLNAMSPLARDKYLSDPNNVRPSDFDAIKFRGGPSSNSSGGNETKEVRDYADKHFGGDYSKSLNFLREKRGYKGN